MKIVSYNLHYAIGKDDRYDLECIATAGSDHQPLWTEFDVS
jgi:endonuclease/exonuclease/phosphatase family metal-dependent hydrolase